jgi:Cu/Ag efflux pump CusA
VLDFFGVSLNTLTLGGLAIAVGIVVDDAIIDVENVWRRLRENSALATPRLPFQVVRDAVLEVRGPVVYATVIVVVIFLPVLTLSGVEGRLFGPLAIASILAIVASLGVAIILTPALCLMLLARAREAAEPRYIRWLKDRHRGVLETLSRRPGLVIGGAAALFAGALATLPFFGGAFLPEFREGLQTATGRAVYARRKTTPEPVFGQIKQVRGFRRFWLRGIGKVQGEWALICLTHNLLKLFRAGRCHAPA